MFNKLKKLFGSGSDAPPAAVDEADLEAEAALAQDDDDDDDDDDDNDDHGAGDADDEIAAAQRQIAEAEQAAAAIAAAAAEASSGVGGGEVCSFERYVELQTLVTHWTQQGIPFDEQMQRAGVSPKQWMQVNGYWAPKTQDPAYEQTFWAVRKQTEAKLSADAYGAEEPDLVSPNTAGPQGIRWARLDRPFGSVETPSGPEWTVLEKPNNTLELHSDRYQATVVLQVQFEVQASIREEYVDSFIGVNQRDAPAYLLQARSLGRVAGRPAARVDGEFTAKIRFATRDYVVFSHNMAVMLMVRGPHEHANWVQSIADRVAASLQ